MYNRSNQRINYFRYINRKPFQSSTSPFYLGYGRTALKAGLLAYNIPAKRNVLVPGYICRDALEAFRKLNIEIKYYSIREDLSPNWDSVNESLSNNCIGILMVHYFGIPQRIEEFRRFSSLNNLLLIEDNSHGHGGTYNNKLLGTFGDIGISSPRKSFPTLNGGILFLNNKKDTTITSYPLEPASISKLIIKDIIGRILDNAVSIKEFFLKKLASPPDINTIINDWSMDRTSHDLLMQYDLKQVSVSRTTIYKIWEKWCRENNLRPVFSFEENSYAPLSMPLIFENKKKRDEWLATFKKNHVAAYIWPDLPGELLHIENSGKDFRDKTLCLPIHLSMLADKLEYFLYNQFIQ